MAPLAIAAILGFAFAGNAAVGTLPIGVSGAPPALVRAAVQASQLPDGVVVRVVPKAADLRRQVANGTLAGGVVVSSGRKSLSDLLIPMVAPGATPSPGFAVVDRADTLVGQEVSEALAAGLASRLYAGRLHPGTAADTAAIEVSASTLGNGGKAVLELLRAVDRRGVPLHRERPRHALADDGAGHRHPRPAGGGPHPGGRHRVGKAAGHRPHGPHVHPDRLGRDRGRLRRRLG